MNEPEALPLAVVIYDPGFEIEPVLGEAVENLGRVGGISVGGVVPRWGRPLPNDRREMLLEEIGSGVITPISQDLGPGADSCILDTDGLTRGRLAISAAIAQGVDVVFVGKFAKQEAAGGGVREEIAEALGAGIPTIVAMRETQIEAWAAFAGDDWTRLAPSVPAIVSWARAVAGKG
jgi:hypothetical protein